MSSMYITVPIESLRLDTVIDFDIYLKRKSEAVLYREANLPFGEKEKEKLTDSKIKEVLILNADRKKYYKYIEGNLDKIVRDDAVPIEKKSELVYGASKELVLDVLENPRSGENIKRSGELISNTMHFILSDKTSFRHLMNVTSYDYYTYTHSVNVGLFSIALGTKLEIKDEEDLFALGWGSILHDVGKTQVQSNILNKDGPLSDDEFFQMKKHPIYGGEILHETEVLPEKAYGSVLEHHEKASGKGYPNKLALKDISYFGKITAVADVFDALTTRRSYKPAIDTFKALSIMKGMEEHFDPDIFKSFVILMGEK